MSGSNPGRGHRSYVQIGTEASWGAGGAATVKLELLEDTLQLRNDPIRDPSLYDARARRAIYPGPYYVSGGLKFRGNAEGLLQVFRAILPAYTATPVVGDTAVIDHLFKESASLTPPSLVVESIRGAVPSGQCFKSTGIMLSNVTIAGKAGAGADGMITVAAQAIGKDMATAAPTSALSFPAVSPFIYHQAQTITDGSGTSQADLRVRDFELSYGTPLDETRDYIGSPNRDQALPNDFVSPTWRLTQEFNDANLFGALKTWTAGALKFIFQRPETIGTSHKRELEIRSGTAQLLEYAPPVRAYGIIIATSSWEAVQDPTDGSSTVIRVRSTESALP